VCDPPRQRRRPRFTPHSHLAPTIRRMPDAPLSHTLTTPPDHPGTQVLTLTGPLTLSTLFGFQDEFRALTPPSLIVDLAGVPYIDSAGLGLLVNYYVSAERQGRRLLLAGANQRVYALLETTHVHTVLTLAPSVEAALTQLS
jgi:anti-anti-sigma factor